MKQQHRKSARSIIARLMLALCAAPAAISICSPAFAIIYGTDDRTDVFAYSQGGDVDWSSIARQSVAALVLSSDIDASDPLNITFNAPTLEAYMDLCDDERFLEQPTAAFCSGTLIDDDLVLTAGHCVQSASDCQETSFVFSYVMQDEQSLQTITAEDVFLCTEIVAHEYSSTIDYAIVRIDPPATPRFTPAAVATVPEALQEETALVAIGTPSGIPLKIDDGGTVLDSRAAELDYFTSSVDCFAGGTGTAVWSLNSGEVVGILVRGSYPDYVSDGACYYPSVIEDPAGSVGFEATYAFRAIDALCAAGGSPLLCGPTVISLSSFSAVPGSGLVILAWSTASELNNAGFNLYRADCEDCTYKQINAELIPAKGSPAHGADYEFRDTDLHNRQTYWYRLEDVDVNGVSTPHGPMAATPRAINRQ